HQLLVTVAVDAHLRVGRLAGIGVAVAAAVALGTLTDVADAQAPAGDVHLVDALIAQVAVAVGPLPVPVVMELWPRDRLNRGRTAPQVVIDLGRRLIFALGPDRRPPLVAQPTG